MFNRYTNTARRAIFFAWMVGFASDREPITSVDLLAGLLWDDDSRGQFLFRLREYFPLYDGRPWKYAKLPERNRAPVLHRDGKLILAHTAAEAARLGDYWIDTEHLLLGILRVPDSTAARYLKMAGLNRDVVCETIRRNKSSRPDYGPAPRFWTIRRWLPVELSGLYVSLGILLVVVLMALTKC